RISGDLRGTAANGIITIPSIGIQVGGQRGEWREKVNTRGRERHRTSLAAVSPDSRISGDLRGTAVNGIITIPSIGIQVGRG
ncbi:unnamed protein product, partial [Closterium sp. NIES-54]